MNLLQLSIHGQGIICLMEEHGISNASPHPGSHGTSQESSSSSSPRRPRLTSSKDRTHSSPGGSRSPRPRNAIAEYPEPHTFAYGNEASSSNAVQSGNGGPGPRRSESDRGVYMHASSGSSSEEQQRQHRDSPAQQAQANESDFPSLSAVSNVPGMSGIGLASNPLPSSYPRGPSLGAGLYSSSPPVTYSHAAGPAAASALARVGAGAATSSTTTTSAAAHRSRSRLPSRNSEGGSADFSHDASGSSSQSRRRQNSQERPKTGVSSGTSNSNSSTWSFFRSASSAHLAQRATPMSDPFAAISEKAEPLLSPTIGRSGVSTPMGYDTGHTTPVIQPSGLNDELRRRIAGLRSESRSRSRTRINYSCSFVLSEGSAGQPGSSSGSFLNAAKRRGRKGSVSSFSNFDTQNQAKRRAEGLVAMAARDSNTSESAKVVVAGRSCECCSRLSVLPGRS